MVGNIIMSYTVQMWIMKAGMNHILFDDLFIDFWT